MLAIDGGAPTGGSAAFDFLSGEPTLHTTSPELVEGAQRLAYRAQESGVTYFLTVPTTVFSNPGAVATIAAAWAAVWDANAKVPGVLDIAETQIVQPLGNLQDVAEVVVGSTSGRSSMLVTFQQSNLEPSLFASTVAYWRGQLDAVEAAT